MKPLRRESDAQMTELLATIADLRRKANDWQMAFFSFIPVPVGIFIFCVLLEVWP